MLCLAPSRGISAAAPKPVVVEAATVRELAPVNRYTRAAISREQARLADESSGRLLPLAMVGGVIGLQLVNLFVFRSLDLSTLKGLIILHGLVVNNAILLVYQTRRMECEGSAWCAAVHQAVQLHLRLILMSTFTSLFAMLPWLLVPGAGSELYRGIAAVIAGGLAISTLLTLILLPGLLRLGESASVQAQADDTIAS